MDADLGRIEQQKEDAYYLAKDFGASSSKCPDCGSENVSDFDAVARERAGGTEEPPYRMYCEDCGLEFDLDC